MSMPETMAEYLVRLSADIDTNSFNAAMMALNSLIAKLKSIKGIAAAGTLVAGFAAIGKSATDAIKGVAAADMGFKRLANQMWITKDSAKALSTAMKVMGVSEEDIAWIPELREQFFRLRNEMNQLATPVDADRQLKWIREIGYDIQSLQVKLKMLKEWVVYYLIKYLGPFIKEFQNFIRWLGDKLGKNMPQIAKKIAEFLAHIVSLGVTALKTIKALIGTVYDFVDSLPANVKKWGAIFATVGAFIMAGPFGTFIMALGGALILLEDFMYYMNGWESSKTLAPIWEKLLQFLQGDTLSNISNCVKDLFKTVADGLNEIVGKFLEGIDWEGIKDSWSKGIGELSDGVSALFKSVKDLFNKIFDSTNDKAKSQQQSFWTSIGQFISFSLKKLGQFAGLMGKIAATLALLFQGDFKGAARMLGVVVSEGIKMTPMGAALGYVFGGNEKANSSAAMQKLQQEGISKEGAAGIIGNLSAESNVDSSNVQKDTQEEKEIYLRRLLNGEMSRHEFVTDEVGFGLAQWTDSDRKGALWDYAAERGLPINDFNMQLDFLLKELREDYPTLYKALCNGDLTVEEASYKMLHDFERPADSGYSVEVDRANRSQQVYDANSFVSNRGKNSWNINPDSWWKSTGNSLFTTPPAATVAPAANNTTNTTIGDINIHVAGTNASANDIGRAVSDVLNARFGRGQIV